MSCLLTYLLIVGTLDKQTHAYTHNGPIAVRGPLIFMAALYNRAGHYILPCGFFLLLMAAL